MIDRDLAELYNTETKILNQSVKRNTERFPDDFMFKLTLKEISEVVTNCDHLKILKYSPQLPLAFTEQGVAMLSSVLKSKRAIEVNITIMRAFVRLKEMASSYKKLAEVIKKLEKKHNIHDEKIVEIFKLIDELSKSEKNPSTGSGQVKKIKEIGFVVN